MSIDELPQVGPYRPSVPSTAEATARSGRGSAPKLRWIWQAMPPAERRARLRQLADWVNWIVRLFPDPPLELSERIPPCWFLHPGPLHRLAALYAEWLRVHRPNSQLPLLSFYDALDRHSLSLGYPGRCRKGRHDELRGGQALMDFDSWLSTSDWTTAPPEELTFAADPDTPAMDRTAAMNQPPTTSPDPTQPAGILLAPQMQVLLDSGDALRLGSTAAVSYDGAWWLGDDRAFVRVENETFATELTQRAQRLAAADEAVERQHPVHRATEPLSDSMGPGIADTSEPGPS